MQIDRIARLISEDIDENKGLESICRLIYRSILNEDQDLPQVLSGRFPALKQKLQDAGINPESLKYLASGDKGAAFSAGDVIVKITEDPKEAMASANLAGLDVPGVNKIHSVVKFADEVPYQRPGDEEPIPTQYYMIIQDVLNTNLSAQEKIAADAVGDFLIDTPKLAWPFDIVTAHRLVKNHHYKRTKELLSGPTIDRTILTLLQAVLGLYMKHRIKFYDVGSRNVGKNKNGNVVLFDLGVSDSPRVEIPVLR